MKSNSAPKTRLSEARLLILGGSAEGFALADTLNARGDLSVTTSLAGVTEAPRTPVGGVRRGGFGGVMGLVSYLRDDKTSAVIDATHPFADGMSRNAAIAAAKMKVPIIHLWRPVWEQVDGDDWTEVSDLEAAASAIPAGKGPVFLTTGRSELSAFAGRGDCAFIARIIQPVERRPEELWPEKLKFVYDKGPFDLARERTLLKKHKIRLLVSKNSGGEAAYPKLAAARELGLPVIMVKRPPKPTGRTVATIEAAIGWLDGVLPAVNGA